MKKPQFPLLATILALSSLVLSCGSNDKNNSASRPSNQESSQEKTFESPRSVPPIGKVTESHWKKITWKNHEIYHLDHPESADQYFVFPDEFAFTKNDQGNKQVQLIQAQGVGIFSALTRLGWSESLRAAVENFKQDRDVQVHSFSNSLLTAETELRLAVTAPAPENYASAGLPKTERLAQPQPIQFRLTAKGVETIREISRGNLDRGDYFQMEACILVQDSRKGADQVIGSEPRCVELEEFPQF